MKRLIIFLVALVVFIIILSGISLYKKNSLAIFKRSDNVKMVKVKPDPKFYWGVFTNGYVFNRKDDGFIPVHLAKQTPYWKDLGVNIIRFNHENFLAAPRHDVNDAMVKALEDNQIIPFMVVEHPFSNFLKEATFEGGYNWGLQIASHYKGRVKFYQLANEVSGTVIKKDYPGNHFDDYDEKKYAVLKDYILGLSKGIRDGDPAAKQVVSAHWIATAIIDRLYDDGLNFDVIGWDWYSEMGDDLTSKKLDDGTTLDIPGHFARMNKPFWIVEVNHQNGDFDDKTGVEQSKFIKILVENSLNSKKIQGFFIFHLFTGFSGNEGVVDKDNSLGIVKDKLNPSTKEYEPGIKNPAYDIYKSLIKKYPQGLFDTNKRSSG